MRAIAFDLALCQPVLPQTEKVPGGSSDLNDLLTGPSGSQVHAGTTAESGEQAH